MIASIGQKKRVEINDGLSETYSTNSQIKSKTLMLKSNLHN